LQPALQHELQLNDLARFWKVYPFASSLASPALLQFQASSLHPAFPYRCKFPPPWRTHKRMQEANIGNDGRTASDNRISRNPIVVSLLNHYIQLMPIGSPDAFSGSVTAGQLNCWPDGNAKQMFSSVYFMEAYMKTARMTLMFLACAAAIPAFAQNTTDSRCGMTNYDSNRNIFTIVNSNPGTPNQQCFITVVPKQSWTGGVPDLSSSQLVEGNYEIALSGGGGGGGGGTERVGGGDGGASAIPFTTVRYLQPGVYRLTLGSGGQGGAPNGGHGGDGAPSSLSNANSAELVAGFPGAESWNGTYASNYSTAAGRSESGQLQQYAQADSSGRPAVSGDFNGGRGGRVGRHPNGQDGGGLVAVAYAGEPGRGGTDLAGDRIRHEVGGGGGGGSGFGNGGSGGSAAEDGKMRTAAKNGDVGAGGGGGAGGEGVADPGAAGGNGFIKLALKDPPPPAASTQTAPASAPAYVAPAETAAPVAPAEIVAPTRPARTDRN